GGLEIRIRRQRLHFGTADQIVAGVMSDLEILDLAGLRALLLVLGIAVVESQIVVIRGDRAEDVVPDDLDGDVGVVGVDQRERLTGDKADHGPFVLRKTNLRGILLGRILVWRRPIDALRRHDLHRHAALDLVVNTWAYEISNFLRILARDEIT